MVSSWVPERREILILKAIPWKIDGWCFFNKDATST
jgi:hypothetical protein